MCESWVCGARGEARRESGSNAVNELAERQRVYQRVVAEEAASQVELAQSKIGKLAAAQREAATAHAEQQAAMASAQEAQFKAQQAANGPARWHAHVPRFLMSFRFTSEGERHRTWTARWSW